MLAKTEGMYYVSLHGQRVRVMARRFRWGDLVLTKDLNLKPEGKAKEGEHVPAGSVLRRNRQLAKDTNGKSEWSVYVNLYDLERAGEHIDARYAAVEFPQNESIKESARQYVQYLVYLKRVKQEDKDRAVAAYLQAIRELSTKRAGRKVVARARLAQALPAADQTEFRDSLGRVNLAAAAMVVGSGIGHLNERDDNVSLIVQLTDLRTLEVHTAVINRLMTYWEAWIILNVNGNNAFRSYKYAAESLFLPPPKAAPRFICVGPMLLDPDCDLRDVATQLRQLKGKFADMVERPFHNNAQHMVEDLDLALAACKSGDRKGLEELVERLRNSISWMFALHVLQVSYITPLAALLNELELRHGKFKPLRKGAAILVNRSLAPIEFKCLEGVMNAFEKRVLARRDDGFRRGLVNSVLAKVAMIQGLMECDNWISAKDNALLLAKKF